MLKLSWAFMIFWLMQTCWGSFRAGAPVCFTGHVPPLHVWFYANVFMNLCLCKCAWVREGGRKRARERERPTGAEARSPDIIEDDISDYPKDRNLSLSMIYFQLFYRPAVSGYAALKSCLKMKQIVFYRIEMTELVLHQGEAECRFDRSASFPSFYSQDVTNIIFACLTQTKTKKTSQLRGVNIG